MDFENQYKIVITDFGISKMELAYRMAMIIAGSNG
jgi:hypothetical protein